MSENDIISDEVKKTQEKADLAYKENINLLTKKFEALYDKADLKWTDSDREDIEMFLDSLLIKAKIDSYIMAVDFVYTILTDDKVLDKIINR